MAKQVRWKGLDDLKDEIMKSGDNANLATAKAIKEVAIIAGRKSDELVPYDTGNLQRSLVIDLPSPRRLRAVLSYGGTSAPYALVQHEDLELFHPPKPPNTNKAGMSGVGPTVPGRERGPKYLEKAVEMASARLSTMIANNLKGMQK